MEQADDQDSPAFVGKIGSQARERTGLQLVRMAIELTCPAGVLPSEQAVNALWTAAGA
ncbi:hypothetical protein NKJ87_20145 [Mesorhizobium sp. M0027]|uniref:hypothetical protein n=1 Tax=unclassified Mesorhizobium TaxID=325217 RepID=UPI00333CD6FB